jgi:hypothetical protein
MSPLYWFVRYALIIALAGVSTLLAPAIDAISAGWMGRSPVLVAVHDTAVLSTPQAQAGDGSPPLAPSVSVAQHRAFTTVRPVLSPLVRPPSAATVTPSEPSVASAESHGPSGGGGGPSGGGPSGGGHGPHGDWHGPSGGRHELPGDGSSCRYGHRYGDSSCPPNTSGGMPRPGPGDKRRCGDYWHHRGGPSCGSGGEGWEPPVTPAPPPPPHFVGPVVPPVQPVRPIVPPVQPVRPIVPPVQPVRPVVPPADPVSPPVVIPPAPPAVKTPLTRPVIREDFSAVIPWLWALIVGLIMLGVGLVIQLIVLIVRRRHGPRWVRTHLRAVAGAVPEVGIEVMESRTDHSPPTCVVRLQSHADSGTQVLEEAHQ